MNQDLANEKINKWGMLLLLDVPLEMHFGKEIIIYYLQNIYDKNSQIINNS